LRIWRLWRDLKRSGEVWRTWGSGEVWRGLERSEEETSGEAGEVWSIRRV